MSFGPQLPPNFDPPTSPLSIEEEVEIHFPVPAGRRKSSSEETSESSKEFPKTQESPHDLLDQSSGNISGRFSKESLTFVDETRDKELDLGIDAEMENASYWSEPRSEKEQEKVRTDEENSDVEINGEKVDCEWTDYEDEICKEDELGSDCSVLSNPESMERIKDDGESSYSSWTRDLKKELEETRRNETEWKNERKHLASPETKTKKKIEETKKAAAEEDDDIFSSRTKMMIRAHLISTKGVTAWQLRGFLESTMGMVRLFLLSMLTDFFSDAELLKNSKETSCSAQISSV